jgi:hypothetical protein
MHVDPALSWERILWRRRHGGASYTLTDLRVFTARGRRLVEIALQDIAEVEHFRSRVDHLLGTSSVRVVARSPRQPAVVFRHVKHGAHLAALIELLAGDPQASLDPAAVQAALSWEPATSARRRGALGALAAVVLAVFAVTAGLQSSSPAPVIYSQDDPIAPGGVRRSAADITVFMESVVMPWARAALAPIVGSSDQVTCHTCHGEDSIDRQWRMPAVAALPEPHFKELGWELYSAGGMDAQIRNAIYGYLAESDKQSRAAYMRTVVLPGMARLLHRPPYDFTRSYEYNRTRAAFGCYHCHRVK